MKDLRFVDRLTLCLATLMICGCGGSGLPEGETGTVSGTVKYKGNPVPEGTTVTFMRSEGGYVAIGSTNAQGDYTLKMKDDNKILVGKYRVSVSAPPSGETLSDDEIMKRAAAGTLPENKSLFPEKYASPESSPLAFEVKTGENAIPIELTD